MWQLLALSLAGSVVTLGVIAGVSELIARYRARRSSRGREGERWG